MQLPHDSIGPTDIIAYRDCPRRFSYSMRRHVDVGHQTDDLIPEAGSWATDYGQAIHTVIHSIEEGDTVEQAVEKAWNQHGRRLEPDDLPSLREDADTYLRRDFPDTRTIGSEMEIRVPLFRYKGRQIYFRTRIDRLLERIDRPGHFLHIDYKSERRPKSEQAVREDLQLWMSNWAIHEYWPEIEHLLQFYDQLRFGQQRTQKTDEARGRIKEWIIREVTRILEDENWREDGLLKPAKNEWCSWCPILESCALIPQLTEWSKVQIAALGPTVKQGRRTVMQLEPGHLEEYVALFGETKDALKILKRFEQSVRELLAGMPTKRREALGYQLRGRRERSYTPEALRAMHDSLGDDRFYELVSITKTDLESHLADDPDLLSFALSLAEEAIGSEALVPVT